MTDKPPFLLIPDEVNEAAQGDQLGKFVQIFPTDVQHVRISFRIWMFVLCFCGVGFFASLTFFVLSHTSWPVYVRVLLWIWLLPLPGFVGFRKEWRMWRTGAQYSLYLYENGFITDLHWRGNQFLDVVSWERIIAVWPDWGKGCLIFYKEATGQEAVIHIQKALKEYHLLAKNIRTQITHVKLPKYIEDFEWGENCSFGRLRGWDDNRAIVEQGFLVTQQGLKYKNQFLPWSDIALVGIKGKQVVIMRQNGSSSPWVSVSARLIANVEVLIGLGSHILKQRNGS